MKRKNKLFSFGLAFVFVFGLFASALPVSAESADLTDTSKYECVGELTENFDGLADVNAFYRQSGEGVLAGEWQRSARGTDGSAAVADGAISITAPGGASDWGTFSGVDFVFNEPLTPDYIVEVSYEMSGEGFGSVFFNNLSDANVEISNVNSMGAGFWDGGFQFLTVNEEQTASGCWVWRSDAASVKAVYNLNDWTYDGTVTIGDGTEQVTACSIGPAAYNDNGGTFVCTPGSTFSRFTLAVRQGTSKFDNISVKVYKSKSDVPPVPGITPEPDQTPEPEQKCAGEMSENFDGLTGAEDLYRKSGDGVLSGTWQRSTRGIGGKAAVSDGTMKLTAPDTASAWDTFSGMDFVFDKPLTAEYRLEISYEISGDGYGAVFFNNLSDENAEINDVNSMGAGYWDGGFQLLTSNAGENYSAAFGCWVNRTNTAYVKAVYNLQNWTYDGTVTIGIETGQVTSRSIGPAAYNDYGGTFVCTPGSKYGRLTFAIRQGTAAFDNISIKAYKIEKEEEKPLNIDFSDMNTVDDMRQKGFLINDGEKASIGSVYENDPMSPSLCINASYNGVNIPAFSSPAYEGAYKVSYWIYNANSDARLLIDAPMVLNGWDDGSLHLLEVRDNYASITTSFNTTRGSTVATLKENTWYRFEHIINISSRTVSAAAYNADGSQVGTTVKVDFANMADGMSAELINHFGGIRIRNWSDMDMFMDNIQIERYFVAPSITKYGVSVLMADGTEVFEKENIDPAADGIILDFGTILTDESAEAGIHLSKTDGETVDFDIETNKGKYILNLHNLLEPNQKYILTVDEEIANEEGTTMGHDFQCTLTTGNGKFSAEAVSFQASGSILENMTGVPGSSALKVNIQYVNSLLNAQNIECIISYYDSNNHTIDKNIYEIEAKASSANTLKLNTRTVPENCSSIEVVLWSDLEAMVPYCDTLTLNEES